MTTTMSYYKSAEGEIITPKRARKEVEDHGIDWTEFLDEFGSQQAYVATSVLSWLGY